MFSFSHIINPVGFGENKELNEIQTITFNSIEKALVYAKDVDVKVYCCFVKGESSVLIPDTFVQLSSLEKTIADFVKTNRKNPLTGEILTKALENCQSDFIIFTNVDIALMPYFYQVVNYYVNNGFDAVTINRRRIKNEFHNETNMDLLYAENGKSHLGYDCFVIKRKVLEKFIFKNIALGVPPSGGDIFYNICAFADQPVLLTEKHLTFHVGMELVKPWGDKNIRQHNTKEFLALLKELKPHLKAEKFPGAKLGFCKRHFKWLMNPTLHYPTMFMLDVKRGFRPLFGTKKDYGYKRNSFFEWMIKRINFDED